MRGLLLSQKVLVELVRITTKLIAIAAGCAGFITHLNERWKRHSALLKLCQCHAALEED